VLRARLATAAVAIPLLLLLILYGPGWSLALVVAAIAIVGVAEYATMAFQQRPAERVLTIVLGILVVAAAASEGEVHVLAAALSLSVAVGLVWTLFARPDFEQGMSDLGLALIGILYAGLLMPHFIWLRNLEAVDAHDVRGPLWVIFVLVIGMAGDTGGYMVGHALGRHKLAPRISPGKTIEGSVGIMLASLAGAVIAKLIFLPQRSWTEVLVLAFVMGVLGQLGDLSESIMKRTFGVKESGSLFPGHGGVLDRIDSLLFPVTFLYYHVAWFR